METGRGANSQTCPGNGKDAFDLWRESILAWGERLEREDPPVLWLSPAGTWVPLRKAAEIKKAVNGKL